MHLIYSIVNSEYSDQNIQLRKNSARTPQELRKNSAWVFMKHLLKSVIIMNLVESIFPDNPHYPQQKYRLTEMSKMMINIWNKIIRIKRFYNETKNQNTSISDEGGENTIAIFRGLRIYVYKNGIRMDEELLSDDVHEVNKLTVIANESSSVME